MSPTPPKPRDRVAWIGLCALVACLLVQVGAGLLTGLGWRWVYGSWPGWPSGLYGVGLGLGSATALTLALAPRRAWVGLLAGLVASPLILLGGEALLSLGRTRHPIGALDALAKTLHTDHVTRVTAVVHDLPFGLRVGVPLPAPATIGWLYALSGVALIGTALVLSRRAGWRTAAQAQAGFVAACGWCLASLPFLSLEQFPLAGYLLWVPAQAAALPFALVVGDWVAGQAFAWIGQAPEREERGATAGADPAARHRARRLARQGEEHAAADRHDDAGQALKQAFELWPSRQRALLGAWSLTRAGEPFQAIDLLAAAGISARELSDDAVLEPLRGLPEWSTLERLDPEADPVVISPWPERVRRAATALLVPVSIAAVVALAHVDEPAAVTLRRFPAHLTGGTGWRAVAEQLEARPSEGRFVVGLTGALVRVDGWPPTPPARPRAIEQAFRQGAEGGDPVSMRRYAQLREHVGVGLERPSAIRWYRAAAEAGDDPARRRLCQIYRTGWGGAPVDRAEAKRWCVEAGHQP